MEIEKEHVSCGSTEDDEGIPLILELSENDILLHKKKKLMEEIGLDPNQPIQLKSSCSPLQLKSVVDLLLQRARIICLNEIELYFGGLDVATSEDFNSLRNELEAFHLILTLIDNLLPTCKVSEANILQHLRDSTVSMIHEFGSNIGDSTQILKEYCCVNEKGLLEWGERNGVNSKLEIAYVEGAGRGAIARENLNTGDVILELPVSVIISEQLVRESDMFPVLEKIEGLSPETMLLLWSMKEKHKLDSKFKLYFDALPEAFNTGLSFGIDAVMALDGTLLLEEIVQAKEHLRTQYDELFPSLCINYPDVFPPEVYKWEHFLWACELWYSNSMKIMFPNGQLQTCLLPVAGFLNHSTSPHILHYGKVDSTTSTLKFCLSRPCTSGEQIFLSYGNFSSSHLLTFYGFLPQENNPYDVIPLDIDIAQEGVSEEAIPASSWSTHMVRGTWLSKNHGIFYYGLPPPLLDYLRGTKNLTWEKDNLITQENLETELEILEDLSSMFESMTEILGDSTLDDREGPSWDVKLALQFRESQKRIIDSLITSCNAGSELLRSELQKYMA